MSAEDAEADASNEALLRDLLEDIAGTLGVDADVEVGVQEGAIAGGFEGDDVGPLIGRRGQTIDAIQHLAQRIVFKSATDSQRVIVDAGGYRRRRREVLCGEGDDAAEEAVRLGGRVEFEPMPASERRVLHEHLRERGDVMTHSEGDEPERYLVVEPAST
ncbi:MAG: Jag family protein [Solirubrobacteraceae bacterium]